MARCCLARFRPIAVCTWHNWAAPHGRRLAVAAPADAPGGGGHRVPADTVHNVTRPIPNRDNQHSSKRSRLRAGLPAAAER